MIDPAHP